MAASSSDFLNSWHPRQVASVQHGVGTRGARSVVDPVNRLPARRRCPKKELAGNCADTPGEAKRRRLLDDYYKARTAKLRAHRSATALSRQLGRHGPAHPRQFRGLAARGLEPGHPPATQNLHHEMELVVAIGTGGADIAEDAALRHVWGYAAGIDMTRRDLQNEAKKTARPWDMSKGFDHSAPIGEIVPAPRFTDPTKGRIELKVNGAVRQSSDLSQMIWSVAETIAFLSRLVTLAPGDLIFTGTPEGVAAVVRGDVLEGMIEGVGTVRTRIV